MLCPNLRLKSYILFLAATGCRATEALSTRLGDYDFTRQRVFIRGKYTKTNTDRFVILTNELMTQLKALKDFKYRTRRISTKRGVEVRTPKPANNHLFFSAPFRSRNPTLHNLYLTFVRDFEHTLDRLGGKYAEYETDKKRRRKITLHSFRRYVKGTISDLGYSDYSEYFIGHSGNTYYRK